MLRKYCFESTADWDEGLPFMLFAIRESVQESLGFSPFELLYGHQVRGPLKVLKTQWFKEKPDNPKQTVTQYLDQLKTKLSLVRNIALENLKKSQVNMKANFDRKAKVRNFNPGDEFLVYIPIPGSPLSSKYQGPYTISPRLDKLNYVTQTPDRCKDTQLVHINLIKLYRRRESADCLDQLC